MLCTQRLRSATTALRLRVLCAFGALLLGACSARLPRPTTGRIPAGAPFEEVPYPPPPARVETIPPQKSTLDVWVDGQWDWDGKAWKWADGAWMTPPSDAYFTPWTAERRSDGRLYFLRAAWRTKDGQPLTLGSNGAVCPGGPRVDEPAR